MLTKLLALLALIGGGLAALFRARSNKHRAEAERERDRAGRAEAAADTRRDIDRAREAVQHKHRKEQIDAQESLDAGRRDHLDGNW